MPARNPRMLFVKLLYIGHSVVVAVPAAYRRKLGWRAGDHVVAEIDEGDGRFAPSLKYRSVQRAIEEPHPKEPGPDIQRSRIPPLADPSAG